MFHQVTKSFFSLGSSNFLHVLGLVLEGEKEFLKSLVYVVATSYQSALSRAAEKLNNTIF
jgi:hypothetical protein